MHAFARLPTVGRHHIPPLSRVRVKPFSHRLATRPPVRHVAVEIVAQQLGLVLRGAGLRAARSRCASTRSARVPSRRSLLAPSPTRGSPRAGGSWAPTAGALPGNSDRTNAVHTRRRGLPSKDRVSCSTASCHGAVACGNERLPEGRAKVDVFAREFCRIHGRRPMPGQ